MKYVVDHDLHIHTFLSSCSRNPKQNPEFLLEYARENNLKRISVTDHFWDDAMGEASSWYKKQNFAHISAILPLPKTADVEFLFGCEGEIRKDLTLGISKENLEKLDMIVIPTTHMHMKGFTVSSDGSESSEERGRLWCDRLEAVLNMDLPFRRVGIAHLACYLIDKRSDSDYIAALSAIPEDRMTELLSKAAELCVGIELNADDIRLGEKFGDPIMRIFRRAKECGCKFYLGSDSHHPEEFRGVINRFENVIDALSLTEDDKFIPA
ncbi:MAG: hypothetical protein IJY69_05430 [Clostridia bacterium]|nr:hypothetical protein [Clostridia bacterium]